MPRLTRQSLTSKKEEKSTEQSQPSGRGKRGSKKTEPVEEPLPIGEGQASPSKAARQSRGKEVTPKEEDVKLNSVRTSSRGRGKKDEEPEAEIEAPPQKRGGRQGQKDNKDEPREPPKRASRGGRGKKEDFEDEEEEEEEVAPTRAARSGKSKKEEEVPPKRAARGGRGKKEEPEDNEKTEDSLPKRGGRSARGKNEPEEVGKPSQKAKGRAGRGGRAKMTEDVDENEEEEVVEESSKGRKSRTPVKTETIATPTSENRRSSGRGKKKEETPTHSKKEDQEDSVEDKEQIAEEMDESSSKDVSKTEEVAEAKQDDKEKMDVDEEMDNAGPPEADNVEAKVDNVFEEKTEPVIEKTMEEQAWRGLKRKHEEDEEESSSKKIRRSESVSEDAPLQESSTASTIQPGDTTDISDFVMVNKEELPAADSKEIQESLPPSMDKKTEEPSEPLSTEGGTNKMEEDAPVAPVKVTPIIVPLTEAELGKQYNPTIRDRDENSSTMVEVGSEAASDIGNISRNLDISEVAPMEVASNTDQPCQDASNLSVASTESSVSEPLSSAVKPTEANVVPSPVSALPPLPPPTAEPTKSKDDPTAPCQTSDPKPSGSIGLIPLPSVTPSQAVPPPQTSIPVPPVQLSPASIPAPAILPQAAPLPIPVTQPPVPAPASNVPLVSIPLPPDVNMSNSSSLTSSSLPHPQSLPTSIPTVPPQNETARNGNCQPFEQVNNSTPLLTSTPAKKQFDSNYVPSSPSITKRKFISNPNFPVELMDPAFCFSVVSYNVLADCHMRRYDYSYTDAQYLELSYRHSLILKELDYLDGDIVCLQEVEPGHYQNLLLPAMTSRGYQGMFKKRTHDWYDEGAATFVKTSKFEVLSYQGLSLKDLAYDEIEAAGLTGDVVRAAKKYLDRPEVVLVCKLLSKKTGKHLTLGNIHVAFVPKAPDVQCIQVASAIKELVSKAGSDLNPYIICGDFNSETTSPAYQLAKDGYLSDEHIRNLQGIQAMDNTEGSSHSIIHFLWKAFQHTSSNLKSAYEVSVGKEPGITSLNGLVKACLDYIFFSSSTLDTVGALEVLDPQAVEMTGGLPSKDIPSDHLSVKALFRLKD